VLDDVIKSRAEAESETYRQKTIDWYTSDLLTRLEEPNGAIILMMTRWHMNDLAGYLLENEADDWEVLDLPALANENDPLGRDIGEALWPEAYSEAVLTKRREQMGEYAFSSLYQQAPMPSKGGLFDVSKIKIVDYAPPKLEKARFYDLAVTAKKAQRLYRWRFVGYRQRRKYLHLACLPSAKNACACRGGYCAKRAWGWQRYPYSLRSGKSRDCATGLPLKSLGYARVHARCKSPRG
jgi:hypothetical protein